MFRVETQPNEMAFDISLDGHPVGAREGETVAAVLLRSPPFHARRTTISGSRRAPFCMMGVCFECVLDVDGIRQRACMTVVRPGMQVARIAGVVKVG